MKIASTNRLPIYGLLFLVIGISFSVIENTYYQYIDQQGFLHESFFLPLSLFALFLSALMFLIYGAKVVIKLATKKQ